MIQNHEEYRSALESAVAALLEAPAPRSEQTAYLMALLHDIEQFHQREAPASDAPFRKSRESLGARIAEFRERHAAEEAAAEERRTGEGVGPTPFVP